MPISGTGNSFLFLTPYLKISAKISHIRQKSIEKAIFRGRIWKRDGEL